MSRCSVMTALILTSAFLCGPARGADVEKYLPDDTQAVLTINFRQILESDFIKKYAMKEIEKGLQSREVQQVVGMLGLDPLKDISSATIAAPAESNDKKVLVIVRGSFDLAKVHDTADKIIKEKPDSLTIHKQDNLRLYEGKDNKSGQPFFACFLSKDVVVGSPTKEYVVDAIAKSTGKKETKSSKGLQSLLGKQDNKQSLWLSVLVSDDIKKQAGQNEKLKELADKLQSISAGVTLTDEIKVQVRISASDPKAAKDIRQQIEGVKALAVFFISGNEQLKDYAPLLLDVLNSFKFSQDQAVVGVDLTIPATLIEKAAKVK